MHSESQEDWLLLLPPATLPGRPHPLSPEEGNCWAEVTACSALASPQLPFFTFPALTLKPKPEGRRLKLISKALGFVFLPHCMWS